MWLAPASRYSLALSRFTPPPSCRPPGHDFKASNAVSLQQPDRYMGPGVGTLTCAWQAKGIEC